MEKQFFQFIYKRNGEIERFIPQKIKLAISKAFYSLNKEPEETTIEKLLEEVLVLLKERFGDAIPGVEDVQDAVEEVLMKRGFADVARAYILYREKRRYLREAKLKLFGVQDDLKLSLNAIQVLRERYLLKDQEGNPVETPRQMMERVARAIAQIDASYGEDPEVSYQEFLKTLMALDFLPNSPTLMNAGCPGGQLAACFVLPIEDSLDAIFEALKNMALIHKSGGGTGFSFSRLRPRGDRVSSTGGRASGPVSFMRIFDTATDVVKQGGKRRGANMGILRFNHPDILEFIQAKKKGGEFENFNFSVAITDQEMEAVRKNEKIPLTNPRDGKVWREVSAAEIFNVICESAWSSGEPGCIFIDEINRKHPLKALGVIEATNPCGEVPLLPFESCNLGSINLAHMVNNGKIDYAKLGETVRIAVHFLDNVIDANYHPLPETERMAKANRKIGLGVMGFADLLVKIGVPYYSQQALKIAEEIMQYIMLQARKTSLELASRRGTFPNFEKSTWYTQNLPLRNATLTSIAPTGSISIIAGCSSGIEPYFALSFRRYVLENTELIEVNPLLEEYLKGLKLSQKDWERILAQGTLQGIEQIPQKVKDLFRTALEIPPEFQVKVQAAFQKYVDNAVSKTINLPQNASLEEVKKVFFLAHETHCKGITVFRQGSRSRQAIYPGLLSEKECETC